ncbi:MAG TPA: UDP-N-acetylmuramoyl-L-alanine--D-glutamate ligase [Clostridiaceae bacterium]|nr:UDP-N-acetylmuramoyl-L-alanine--D-glutamate ligase [Clostridiaceae bacterium]
MERKYADFKNWLKDKKIAVIGLGISNQPLLRLLAEQKLNISAFDKMPADSDIAVNLKNEFQNLGYEIKWYLGDDYLDYLIGFDLIFRTPIMMPYNKYLLAEKARGAIITSEMEVFLQYCPGKTFAVTGSDGKSTTTSLIYRMLKQQTDDVYVGGNIGRPLLADLEQMTGYSKVVLELSSFQLIDLQVSPNVAVLTNVTPNHLDVHQNYDEYIEAKKQLYRHQSNQDKIILNGNFPEFAVDWSKLKGELIWFNQRYECCTHQVYQRQNGQLGYCARGSDEFVALLNESDLHLMGDFNLENCLSAMAAVQDDVSLDNIRIAVQNFKGLEHRLEFIREIDQVKFYNSSIDSSPERSKHTLSAFIKQGIPTVLIMGGKDKNSDYRGLGKIVAAATDKLILCGANADLIEKQVRQEAHQIGKSVSSMQIIHCDDYEDALERACRIAMPGESIILSPAGTSFDRFKNFEERGNYFKNLVNGLFGG